MNRKRKAPENRASVIQSISSWLKLLALIVLCVEAVLITGLARQAENDPLRPWYIPLMLGFCTIVVIGLFVDRYTQARIANETSPETPSMPQPKRQITIQKTGRVLDIELADNIAIVSPALRQQAFEKIHQLVQHKIRVHAVVFEHPMPSAILPVDDKYFGRFSWDDKRIICHELFEVPTDIDQTRWAYWCTLQQLYVEAFASDHRHGQTVTEDGLKTLATRLGTLCRVAKKMVFSKDQRDPGVELLLVRLDQILSTLNYADRSDSQRNCVVQLETALSTAHDLIKRTMPRVIPL